MRSQTLLLSLASLAIVVSTQAQTSVTTQAGIQLDKGWQTPFQGGSATLKDFGAILSPFAKPGVNMSPSPDLHIYGEVTYLMPFEAATKALGLVQKVVPKNKVNCPGFPKDSFFHYAFDGSFEGHFNKLYIVTDKSNQVVAIQLVSESPRADQVAAPFKSSEWHTYNFVNYRTKALKRLWIDHKPYFEEKGAWKEYRSNSSSYYQPKGEVGVLRIDSLLMDPDMTQSGNRGGKWKPLEAVRLYLPHPMMELILQCVNAPSR